jgi:hypothetical protein
MNYHYLHQTGPDWQHHLFEPKTREAYDRFPEVRDWCEEVFGPTHGDPPRWCHLGREIWFYDDNDAMHFKLRWG